MPHSLDKDLDALPGLLERWIDHREDFTLTSVRGAGVFLLDRGDVVASLELLPAGVLTCWAPTANQAIDSVCKARELERCNVTYPAFPLLSLDMLRQNVLNQPGELRRRLVKHSRNSQRTWLPSAESLLDDARRYAWLSRVLNVPLVTPVFADVLHEWLRKTSGGRRHYGKYQQLLEVVEGVVTGYAQLEFDPVPLGLANVKELVSYQRLRSRQVAAKLEGSP